VGRLEHLLGVADERIQHRGDDLLRFDSINEQRALAAPGMGKSQISSIADEARPGVSNRSPTSRHSSSEWTHHYVW